MTTQPNPTPPRKTDAQIQAALWRQGLTIKPGLLNTPDGQPVKHDRIIWQDTGGIVWHGSARRRCINF